MADLEELQQIFGGRVVLAEVMVHHKKIVGFFPKVMTLRKDVDQLTHEVTYLKDDVVKYARIRELEQTLTVLRSNQEQYTDEKIKELRKDMNLAVAGALEPLSRVPQASDYVLKSDHKIFARQIYTLQE